VSETCKRCGAILNTSRAFVERHGAKCTECTWVWAMPVAEDLDAGEAAFVDVLTQFAVVKLTSAPGIVRSDEPLRAGDYVRVEAAAGRLTKVDLA
jgi:hypothetical protein